MGEVYRAHDERLHRDVAVKVLPADVGADPERLRRFEVEARAAGGLNHPAILAIHDFGQHEGMPYLVSELLDGETLRSRLVTGPLALPRAVDLAVQIALGLAAAHDRGIVHRDLKPDNLFLTRDGHIKILDFGLAKPLAPLGDSSAGDGHASTMAAATAAGAILGTAGYMAPEQVRGQAVDHRADVFAFGAVLHEMLAGAPAFVGPSLIERAHAALRDDPTPIPGAPPGLQQVVRRCLEKRPEDRFQSMRDLAFQLRTLGDSPVSTRRPWIAAALGGLLIAAAVAAVIWGVPRRSPSATRPPPAAKDEPMLGRFLRLAPRHGIVENARVGSDGKTVLYDYRPHSDTPPRVYTTLVGRAESRPVTPPGYTLDGLSADGQLLVRRDLTLASMPLLGGAPRVIAEEVMHADMASDGTIAFAAGTFGHYRIEWPPGKVVATNPHGFGGVRISPSGQELAFVDAGSPTTTIGKLVVIDRTGKRLFEGPVFNNLSDPAWGPGGEVWVTASHDDRDCELIALAPNRPPRTITRLAGWTALADIIVSPERTAAVVIARELWSHTRVRAAGEHEERDLDEFEAVLPIDLSADGRQLLYMTGPGEMYVQGLDGSPPIQLGAGSPFAVSPDGKWVLASLDQMVHELSLVPVGAGQPRRVQTSLRKFDRARFFADGKRALICGAREGEGLRTWIQDLDGGEPRAVTEVGVLACQAISPDGKRSAGFNPETWQPLIARLDRPAVDLIAGLSPNQLPLSWSRDAKTLYVAQMFPDPLKIFAFDLGTHRIRSLVERSQPPWHVVVGPDGSYAYGLRDRSDQIFLVEGLR
jgi:hypothetical protein